METWNLAKRRMTRFGRRAAKQALAAALEGSGARNGIGAWQRRRAGGRRVEILAWHRVVPDFGRLRKEVIPGLLTSTETFDRQLRWIGERFRFGTLDDAVEVLAGRAHFDRDLCVLTFDDGYADFLEHALPILRAHRAPATLYVATGIAGAQVPLLHDRLFLLLREATRGRILPEEVEVEEPAGAALRRALQSGDAIVALEWLLETQPRRICVQVAEALERRLGVDPMAAWGESKVLGWEGLVEAARRGAIIGAHTVDHACLPNETGAEVERQLVDSKVELESRLQGEVAHFAYPNGWYSPSVIRAVARAGYRSAVTTEDRQNRLGGNPYTLKRRSVWEYTSRGILGFSKAVHACNFDGTLATLGIAPWTPGEKPDGLGAAAPAQVHAVGATEQIPSGA